MRSRGGVSMPTPPTVLDDMGRAAFGAVVDLERTVEVVFDWSTASRCHT